MVPKGTAFILLLHNSDLTFKVDLMKQDVLLVIINHGRCHWTLLVSMRYAIYMYVHDSSYNATL